MKLYGNIKILRAVAFIWPLLSYGGNNTLFAQDFKVEKVSFSTRYYDELSPVFYKNGLVFCTNRRTNSLIGYENDNNGIFKLFYSESNSGSGWKSPVLFSNEISTGFNEGPATFNKQGTLIYFTKNNGIASRFTNVADTGNKLGIYSAELIGGVWQNIRPFEYNNPLYTFATPALSFDENRIYFASDMPGGYGGMDIYYCEKCSTGWCKPVNAGSEINTSGNETYPYANAGGKIYFSSDGHPGRGGKDIYFSFENKGTWAKAVGADSLINSGSDDYGIIVDSTGLKGYFTSDRFSSEDIFSFSTILPEYTQCDTFREPPYCFTIYDERYIPNDTLILHYVWNFGNGILKYGPQVNYCFPGPGDYKIFLDITDEITGDTIAWQVEYNVTLDPPVQLFINSPNVCLSGEEMEFNTAGSSLKASDITDYSWDFGEGFKPGISHAEKKYRNPGFYTLRAGMKGTHDRGCILKNIRVLESVNEVLQMDLTAGTTVSISAAGEVTSSLKPKLERLIKKDRTSLIIDADGIHQTAIPFLMQLVSLLAEDPGLHLEIQIYNKENEPKSLSDSRELSFFFKNHASPGSYGVRAVNANELLTTQPAKVIRSNYEFIFMKK